MFVLPAASSIALDVLFLTLFWVERKRDDHLVFGGSSSFQHCMADILVFTGLRLLFLTLFATMFYKERRMSLRLPLSWEAVNLALIVAKGLAFLANGAPFHGAWLLLGVCTASIGLELVCVAHLRSSAGMLPLQHVFLHSAVGAMATMNLSTSDLDASCNHSSEETRILQHSESLGGRVGDLEAGRMRQRQNSYDERRQFLSDWNGKVDKLRQQWAAKVDELRGKLNAARRSRSSSTAAGGSGGGGGGGGFFGDGDGEGAPLLLLARMFAQEQAAIEELEGMWNRNPRWTEFFLPQYTLFLLYASFVHSARLEELLLARCESSVQVAHSLYWFLKAFCVQGAGVTPVGVKAIEQMLKEVVVRGERPAQSLIDRGWANRPETPRYMELFQAHHEGKRTRASFGGFFGETTSFVDELTKIAAELSGVAKEYRTSELRRRLREVQSQFLPSRAVYLPVGRKPHRVYRIAVEESFSFSTKDRAPYLVTLEVLDFSFGRALGSGGCGDDNAGNNESNNSSSSKSERNGHINGTAAVGEGREPNKLMRMLTPSTLGRSLMGMKADIDRTLTTLKRSVSKEGGEGAERNGDGGGREGVQPGAAGGGGDEPPDVESNGQVAGLPAESNNPPSPDGTPVRVTPRNGSVQGYVSIDASTEGGGDIERPGFWSPPSPLPQFYRYASKGSTNGYGRLYAPSSTPTTSSYDTLLPPPPPARDTDEEGEDDDDDDLRPSHADNGTEETKAFQTSRAGYPGYSDVRESGEEGGVSSQGVRVGGEREIPPGEERFSASEALNPGLRRGGDGEGGCEQDEEPAPPSRSSTDLMGMWSRPSNRSETHSSPPEGSPTFLPTGSAVVASAAAGGARMGASWDKGIAAFGEAEGDGSATGAGAGVKVAPPPLLSLGDEGTSGPRTPVKQKKANGTHGGNAVANGDLRSVTGADVQGAWRLEPERGGGGAAVGGGDAVGSEGGGRHKRPETFTSLPAPLTGGLGRPSSTMMMTPSPESRWSRSIVEGQHFGGGVDSRLLARGDSPASSGGWAGYGSAAMGINVPQAAAAGAASAGGQEEGLAAKGRLSRQRGPGYADLRHTPMFSYSFSSQTGGAGNGVKEDFYETDREEEDEDGDGKAGSEKPRVIFKERWRQKEARLKQASKLGGAKEWRLLPVIVKAGDDLRQEQLASQFFALAQRILKESPLGDRAGLRPYDIVATSPDAGIIEAIPDTVSLDALKKNDPKYTTLSDFFYRHFGPPGSGGFLRARRYFVESLAANCIVTYLLQVKDRHNGNILLDARGRVIHIDFGFMLTNSPGGNFKFESAPFKLTAEFVDLMDGPSSACFKGFRELCVQTFMTLRRKMSWLVLLVETSSVGNAHLPCFGGKPEAVVGELRSRFKPEVHDLAAIKHVNRLIDTSMNCWRTSWYDWYQNYTVGIAV